MQSPILFNNVWKKFKRGEKFNSLRDTIPYLLKKMFSRETLNADALDEKEFWAVNDVSFEVKKGEVLGIIGPNGAGKSTILKLLSGIMLPQKGTIHIEGRLSALIEVTAGFHPELTGRENVYLNGTILGMKRKEIDEQIENIIEFSGIGEFIDTPVKRYSSGMFSRLGFSVAAHVNPEILLVDEVLAVGDIAFRSKCAQKMRDLLKTGATIVLVSHNLPLVQSLCKRVLLLHMGKIIKDGSPEVVIPYYENIVFLQQEEEFKKKIEKDDFKIKVNDQTVIDMPQVQTHDGSRQIKDGFDVGESLTIQINYHAKQRVENPIFTLEIIRADGVICCSSSSQDEGLKLESIDQEGVVKIHLEEISLAPGIYFLKTSIWDKEMIHPYVVRKKDVLRINVIDQKKFNEAVFIPTLKWESERS